MPEKQRVRGNRDGRERYVHLVIVLLVIAVVLVLISPATAQRPEVKPTATSYPAERTYPKEIRGYKVERAKVEIKKPKETSKDETSEQVARDADALIQFGEPSIARMTPLGITLEVPVTVSAVKQKGHVDFLTFEDMVVNGIPVTVEEYKHPFELPTKKATQLPTPVRLFISTARALMGALGEWNDAKLLWPVTGRVYVFGQFKKFIFKFKRVVPVELVLTLPNPLLKTKGENDKPK